MKAVGGVAKDYGVVSTPQLHYFVVCQNTNGAYGVATEEGYYKKLTDAFKKIRGSQPDNGNYKADLSFDGANGVGAAKMRDFLPFFGDSLRVEIVNDGTGADDVLNSKCGADFVKVQQAASRGLEGTRGKRCVAVDGDADRVMYFFNDASGKFNMLDGDKIATLVAGYLKELCDGAKIDLNLGIVQTAYANGSSTNFITNTLVSISWT